MKLLASLGLFVFLAILSFPLSADAFGKRPDSSEVNQSRHAQTRSISKEDVNGRTPQAVPEPSSIVLFGIAMGLVGLVSMRKWLRRTAE